MPRRKRVRSSRNRPQRSRSSRKIAQLSSGIPSTKKRVSGNPPVINETTSQAVKVAFNVSIVIAAKAAAFKVVIGDSPFGENEITLTVTNSADKPTFYLDLDEIFYAAYVRVFGSKPTEGTAIQIATEMALASVTFYGPLGAHSIRMGVDFGPGMPGAIASDAGTLASRPVVKATSPRLYWDRLHSIKAGDAAAGFWIFGFNPPGIHLGAGDNACKAVGRIDCVVHVRRSWYSANTASAHAAKTATETMMA